MDKNKINRLVASGGSIGGSVNNQTLWPFGKWKDTPLQMVPSQYLIWCIENLEWFSERYPALFEYIEDNKGDWEDTTENNQYNPMYYDENIPF